MLEGQITTETPHSETELRPRRRQRGARQAKKSWRGPRWAGIQRNYSSDDVESLKGSLAIRHTLAEEGAKRLWTLLQQEDFVAATANLGASTGNQAMQMAATKTFSSCTRYARRLDGAWRTISGGDAEPQIPRFMISA